MVWGVIDKTLEVAGTKFSPYSDKNNVGNELLVNWLARSLNPHCDFRFHEFEYKSKHIVIIEIDRAKTAPVKYRDCAYIRIDSCSQKLSKYPEIERKLWKLNPHHDWSAEICREATIKNLEPEAIAKARVEFKEKYPKQSGNSDAWSDEIFLNKAKFCVQGQITNAAILLLGKPESEHFLTSGIAKISWILKDDNGVERDYEHFGPPFILNAEKVFKKVRILRYRYMQDGTLFPTEVDQYDPWVIREALHNCIAHQDYTLSGRISVVEMPDKLIFANVGEFIPGTIEEVIHKDSPEAVYRNRFLADAMVNCQMIDIIGSGIRKMFFAQKNRYFPLPEYRIEKGVNPKIELQIEGKVLDLTYAKILLSNPDIDIETTMLLDKVQRKVELDRDQVRRLKSLGLVEGRGKNIYLSASIAETPDKMAEYIDNKGFDDDFYCEKIMEYIKQFNGAVRADIEKLIIRHLPKALNPKQKKKKIDNLLQKLKLKEKIYYKDRKWQLVV